MQKIYQFRQTTARLAVSLFILFALASRAAAQSPPQGDWEGSYDNSGRLVATKLNLKKFELGDRGSSMRWFSPYDCTLSLEFAGKLNGVYEMRIFSSNGGKCDHYRGGVLDLTVQSEASLQFSLKDGNNSSVLQGELSPAGS